MRTRFACLGWIISVVLGVVLLYLLPRLHIRALERTRDWEFLMAQKQIELTSVSWEDTRPLSIWLGDSHVEYANWYDLFNGTFAVRNCGMAMATIRDVAILSKSIPEKGHKTVVILCGINNVLRGDSVENCVKDYEFLLNEVRSTLNPESFTVIAVMPVRQTLMDGRGKIFNKKVAELNLGLEKLCRKQSCSFLDINACMMDAGGGLVDELTEDGLHLNRKGYKVFAAAIRKHLPK